AAIAGYRLDGRYGQGHAAEDRGCLHAATVAGRGQGAGTLSSQGPATEYADQTRVRAHEDAVQSAERCVSGSPYHRQTRQGRRAGRAIPWQPCAAPLECGTPARSRDAPAGAVGPAWSSRSGVDLSLRRDRHRVAARRLASGSGMTTIVTAAKLRRDVQESLRFKRAMGIVYRRAEFDLDGFVDFVAQRWGDRGEVALEDAISHWCVRIPGRKAVTLGNEFGVIRQLCLYRRRRDPSSYVPEHALAPIKESIFLPYIFSHDEVRRLLAAATSHQGRFIGAPMLRALVLVLYCTGLRLGEAVRLRVADVDLDPGSLLIRHSKGRSRIVPIRADLVAELRRYTAERQRLICIHRQANPEMFFLRLDG